MSFFKLKLKNKQIKYEDVAILDFVIVGKEPLIFKAGQYLNLYSQEHGTGRSYTILSSPNKKMIRFAVRKKGEFSSFLFDLKLNKTIDADGPHGIFYPDNPPQFLICIANGIGVTPFINWIGTPEYAKTNFHFLFSNSNLMRSPFLEEIKSDKRSHLNLFITRQNNLTDKNIIKRRIQKDDIKKVLKNKKDAIVAICGSISFTRDMWKIVKSIGVAEENIITEAFF